MVSLKLALTLDGRIATRTGESRWITGPEARRYAHLLRARHDAILVGVGTARADDPMLDVREIGLAHASPVRVLADPALSLPLTARLLRSAGRIPLWIAHRDMADPARRAAMAEAGAEPFACPVDAAGQLDVTALLAELARRGITRLLCEGGGRMAASLIAAGAVDRLVTVTAGAAIGGDGVPGIGAMGLARLADAPRFRLAGTRLLGADLMAEWEPAG